MILYLIPGLLLAAAAFAVYMGVFKKVIPEEKKMSAVTYLYKQYQGRYEDMGKVFQQIIGDINNHNKLRLEYFENNICLAAVYYDDPTGIEDQTKARALAGFVLFGGDKDDARIATLFKEKGYETMLVPASQALLGTFPHRNKFSLKMGAMKAYPAMISYMKKNGERLNVKEVFKQPGSFEFYWKNDIDYWFPLENREIFSVMKLEAPEMSKAALEKYKKFK